jgi:hypothetical protein
MRTPMTGRISRLLLVIPALAFAAEIGAVPITYTEVISGYGGATDKSPSGTLGGVAFGGLGGSAGEAVLKFIFQGDTSDVVPFSVGPTHGYEILVGTASVQVLNTVGNVLAQGAFLPSAGIYVSIDNTNLGVGFGSLGALPSDPQFPGQPLYPYAIILNGTSDVGTFDLKGNDIIQSVNAASCVNFPGICAPAFALPTAAGDLFVDSNFGGQFGTFTATSVPEPSTLILVGLAIAGLGALRKRKKN